MEDNFWNYKRVIEYFEWLHKPPISTSTLISCMETFKQSKHPPIDFDIPLKSKEIFNIDGDNRNSVFDKEKINKRIDELNAMEKGFNLARNEAKNFETLYAYYKDKSDKELQDCIKKNQSPPITQEKKDWEIVSFEFGGSIYTYNNGIYLANKEKGMTLRFALNNNIKIKSVRRLSDNEIFSVGDEVMYSPKSNYGSFVIDYMRISTIPSDSNRLLVFNKDESICEEIDGHLSKKSKDYEVISYGVGFPTPILKVKRLSDNSVWSVGDGFIVTPGFINHTIEAFRVDGNAMAVIAEDFPRYTYYLPHLERSKAKQPLFTTEQQKEIIELVETIIQQKIKQ